MTVHSIHVFDRRGKTLFTKTYSKDATASQRQLQTQSTGPEGEDQDSEQRKLVFGMLFSLRELMGSLAPEDTEGGEINFASCWRVIVMSWSWRLRRFPELSFADEEIFPHTVTNLTYDIALISSLVCSSQGLHAVKTGAGTLHNYETISGIRFAIYTSNDITASGGTRGGRGADTAASTSVREALRYVYTDIWVECVVKSPLYRAGEMGVVPIKSLGGRSGKQFGIESTHFERRLDSYLQGMPWFH